MNHSSTEVFDEVANAAIPIIASFNSQALASTVCALARSRAQGDSIDSLYLAVAHSIKAETDAVSGWEERHQVEAAYAFMKAGYLDNLICWTRLDRRLLIETS